MNEILDSELSKENEVTEVNTHEETLISETQEEPTAELLAENEQLTKDEIIQKVKGMLTEIAVVDYKQTA